MIPINIWEQIKYTLLGTCMSLDSIMENFQLESWGVSVEYLEEALEIDSIQLCPECGWWVESYELEEDGEEVSCEDCRFN